MADYFDEVVAEVRQAQQEDPDVVLPWSWWRRQAERHGMTPNAVYTRAIKVGLYVHPAKRGQANVTSAYRSTRDERKSLDTSSPIDGKGKRSETASKPSRSMPSSSTSVESVSPSQSVNPGDAVQSVSSLAERAAGLERRITELTHALEETKAENKALKRALREMDALAEKIRQSYIQSLNIEL